MRQLRFLGGTLGCMEQASLDGAGARYFFLPGQTEPVGMIMAEGGRICWASCHLASGHLSDILRTEADLSREEMDQVFQICQTEGQHLGETLLARGMVTEDLLRRALLRHTASALVTLVALVLERGATISDFIPAPDKTYEPMFTFAAGELIMEAMVREVDLQLEAAYPPMAFDHLTTLAKTAICLVETDLQRLPALPIFLTGMRGLSIEDFTVLYENLKPLVVPPQLQSTDIEPYAVLFLEKDKGTHKRDHRPGGGWMATYSRPHLSFFELETRFDGTRLLSALLSKQPKTRIRLEQQLVATLI